MEINQLPDLSGWRYVEVWTLEEAAMLWAAIDPADYVGVRIVELKDAIPSAQYKKAWMSLRAVTEAVCAGTLPFVEAWEGREDDRDNYWRAKVEFPEVPDPNNVIHHMTRINQVAFLKWAHSKNVPSYRKQLIISAQKIRSQVTTLDGDGLVTISQDSPNLLLPIPDFLDPSNPLSPEELRISAKVWEFVVSNGLHERGKTPKNAIREVLDSRPEFSHLSKDAKDRIAMVTNWKRTGGPPKTPGG